MLGGHAGELLRILGQIALEQAEHDLELLGLRRGRVRHGAGLLELDALVHEQSGVTAVVEDHVGAVVTGPVERLLGAPPVLLERLALPGEHGDAGGGDGSGGVVLGGEDVARHPAHLGAQRRESLDQHRRLHGHVQGAHDAGALQGLGRAVLLAHGHEAGHLVLGQADLLAAEIGQGDVRDLVIGRRGGRGIGNGHAAVSVSFGVGSAARRRWCFCCSQESQSPVLTSAGFSGRSSNQRSTAVLSSGIGGQPAGERHVREGAVEPGEQLAQRPQALQLTRSEEAIPLGRAGGLDQAGTFDVAQHARRPAGRLCGLVDREPLHRRRQTLPRSCQGLGHRPDAQPRCCLKRVDRLDRSGIDVLEHRHVDAHEITEQNLGEHALEAALPVGRHLHRGRAGGATSSAISSMRRAKRG